MLLTTALVTVAFLAPGEPLPEWQVTHDPTNPAHSRGAPPGWTVTPNLGREDNCRAVIDARRVIAGRRPTNGVPLRCMSRRDRRIKPDPAPLRKG